MISTATLSAIRERVSLIEVLERHGVTTAPVVAKFWRGTCPYCKGPHFWVVQNRDKQEYLCLPLDDAPGPVCRAMGDVIGAAMRLRQISYRDAVSYLAELGEIAIEETVWGRGMA